MGSKLFGALPDFVEVALEARRFLKASTAMTSNVVTHERERGRTQLLIISAVSAIAVVAGIAAMAISSDSESRAKIQISETLTAIISAQTLVTNYMVKTGEVPKSLLAIGFSPPFPKHIASIEIVPTGTINTVFSPTAHADLAGKQIAVAPYATKAHTIEWACGSPDIAKNLLPTYCLSTSLPTGIAEYLSQRRTQAKLAAEEEAKRRYESVMLEVEKSYPELNKGDSRFSQRLADEVQSLSEKYVAQYGKERSVAIKQAAAEIMFEDIMRKSAAQAKIEKEQELQRRLAAIRKELEAIELSRTQMMQQIARNGQIRAQSAANASMRLAQEIDERYALAEQAGSDLDACSIARNAANEFLGAKNENKYFEWKQKERVACERYYSRQGTR